MNQIQMKSLKSISTVAIVLLAIPTFTLGKTFSREVLREFDASVVRDLSVETGSGQVDVKGSDTPEIIINIVLSVQAPDEESANAIFDTTEITFEELENSLAVSVKKSSVKGFFSWIRGSKSNSRADISILVPNEMDLSLNTGSGGISLKDVAGILAMSTGSGSISGVNLSGTISARTGSGSINLNDSQGVFDARTGSGRIDASGQLSSFSLHTGSGSIDIQSSTPISEDSSLKTGSGGVRVQLPPQSGFQLNAAVGSGSIDCGFSLSDTIAKKRSLKGIANDSGPNLRIRTGSGSIRVHSEH